MKKILLIQLFIIFTSRFYAQSWEVVQDPSNQENIHSTCYVHFDGNLYFIQKTPFTRSISSIDSNGHENILFTENSSDEMFSDIISYNDTLILIYKKYIDSIDMMERRYYSFDFESNSKLYIFNSYSNLNQSIRSSYIISKLGAIYYLETNLLNSNENYLLRKSSSNIDTCFTFQWNNTFRFISTTPDGFIFYQEFPQGANASNSFYQYSHTSGTYTQITMPDGKATKGVEFQNGALLDGKMEIALNNPSINNIKYVNANGTVQGWSDPNFIGPEYITKGDKGIYFSVRKDNLITGNPEYSVQKLVLQNVYSQLNYSEKFYDTSAFGGLIEVKPRLIAISKDYLYAYQPYKLDNVLMPGGLLRIKLLNANNLAPVAVNDVFQVTDTMSTILTMRANDTDPNNDYIYSEILQYPSNGTALHLTNQDLKYTPPLYFTGNDTIVYKACDLGGLCSQPATIIIQVTASGVQPLAVDDQSQTYQAQNVLAEVINNDDFQNQPYELEILQNGVNGLGVLQGDSAIFYDPVDSFTGLDSIVYRISRTTYGYADTATLYINVEPHPFAPSTEADTLYLTSNVTYVAPLVNDTNPTGGMLTMNVIDGPFAPGAFYGNQSATVFYYYNNNYQSTTADSILYEACNVSGLCTQEWIRFYGGNVGLTENLDQKDFLLYPNPTGDWVSIKSNETINGSISVTDEYGRRYTVELNENGFSVQDFSPGVYFIELQTVQGIHRKKLIVE